MPSPKQALESPQETMDRIRSELASRGEATGARRQLNIEREAGLSSFRSQPAPQKVTSSQATAPTQAELQPSATPVDLSGQFVQVVRDKITSKVEQERKTMLNADESYDTQLALARGSLFAALAGKATEITPEELRFLSPSQQAAVRSGDKAAIEAAIIGTNSILQERAAKKIAEEERAAKQFELFSQSGTSIDQLPVGFLEKLDQTRGVPVGTHASIYKATVTASEEAKELADIEAASKLITVLEKLPPGKSITIGGTTYSSLNVGDVITGTEDGADGTYLWTYNKDTGERTTQYLGNFGNQKYTDIKSNEGAIVRLYENGNKRLMFDPRQPNGGVASGGLVELFPEGSVTPFERPNDPFRDRASECGAWVNDITGIGFGDSFTQKMSKVDRNITGETAQIGDVFVQPAGSTGHVGIINGKSVVDGETIFTVSESNWSKKPGTDGKVGIITHTRQVKASDISGYARPGFAQDFYNFGTDAQNLSGLTFGDDVEEDKPFSAEVAKLVSNTKSAIDDVDILIKKVTNSPGRGRFLDREYKAAETNIIDVLGRMRSGGAITEDEVKSFEKLLPGITDSDNTSKSKLQRLKVLFNDVLSGISSNGAILQNEPDDIDALLDSIPE